jgi:integrase
MLQKLTVTSNRDVALMPPGKYRVEGETGLYLWVAPDGQVRRWLFRFTSPVTNRVTEAGLDLAPAVSLADAKAKAMDLRRQIANGVDPIHAKRAEKANQTTFKEAAEQWIAVHQSSWKPGVNGRDGSQMKNAKLLLFHHGEPLSNVPVKAVTPDMVQAALEPLWNHAPHQGRRTLMMWARVMDYAKAKGMRQGDNPCEWRGCHQYRFPRVRSVDCGHFPALPYEQMPTFVRELRQRQSRGAGALALEFTILTVARTSEVLGMTWSEINWDKKLWVIEATRMKAGKKHEVPLPERALEILRQQQICNQGSGFVFEGYNRTRLAERTMRCVMHRMGMRATTHGFRSTFRNWAGDETHFQREIIEECLAHQVGNAVERAYRRTDALNKRRVIMQAWAEYCAGDAVLPAAQAAE